MSLNAQLYKQTAGPDQKWSSFLIKWGCSGELIWYFIHTMGLDHHHHHHRFIVLVFDNPSEWKLRRTEEKIYTRTDHACLLDPYLSSNSFSILDSIKKKSKELKHC